MTRPLRGELNHDATASFMAGRTYRRDFFWQLHLLGNRHLSVLHGALHVDVLELVADVQFLGKQTNQPIFDLHEDLGALLDCLGKTAACFDREFISTAHMLQCQSALQKRIEGRQQGGV